MIADLDLLSVQHARILAENAAEAQRLLALFSQEKLDAIVEHVAQTVEGCAKELAQLSQQETDYGNWPDKWIKNQFVCSILRKELREMRCVGLLRRDENRKTVDIGVPVGVIAAFCPVTSPVSTTVYKALLAIKSGNAIIFSPHPGAAKSISRVISIMSEAAQAKGLPEGCLACLNPVAKAGSLELMKHPAVTMLMLTGVPGLLDAARASGKPLIYGGTGNGPAFIERSADIAQAVRDIVRSQSFDNGLAPSAEHSLVVESCIEADVRCELLAAGAYFMSNAEADRLANLFYYPDGRCCKGSAGKPAIEIAKRAGFAVPENTRLLIADRKYVTMNDPYCKGFPAPVLAFYLEDDWMNACERCIEILLTDRNAHTMSIHSRNEEVILAFGLKKPVGRLLVNTPASFGGIGATTNLFPAMTLGSGVSGFGITSDNVSPLNLVYIRKIGYGVRSLEGTSAGTKLTSDTQGLNLGIKMPIGNLNIDERTMQRILTEALAALKS